MGMKHVIGVTATLAVLAMSACQSPAVSLTPTPAFSELEGEALQREAIRVHRLIIEEQEKYETLDNPPEELPETLTVLLDGAALESLERVYTKWREEGLRGIGEPPVIGWVRPSEKVEEGAVVGTTACIDARYAPVINRHGDELEGGVSLVEHQYRWHDGRLVAFLAFNKDVEEC
jgi:hypothetical protein